MGRVARYALLSILAAAAAFSPAAPARGLVAATLESSTESLLSQAIAEIQRQRSMQGLHRAARGIVLGLDRQIAGDAGDRAYAHPRFVDAAQAHLVADGFDGVSENIEAYADVGNGGRCERGNIGKHYRCAPR